MFAKRIVASACQKQSNLSLFNKFVQQRAVVASVAHSYSTQQQDDAKYSVLKGEKIAATSEHTIGYHLSALARASPFANAVRSSHQKMTHSYSVLKKNVEALACGLLELGMRPGDRLALIQGNNMEHIVTLLACAKIGVVLAEFPAVKNAKDFTKLMELVRPRIVITPHKLAKNDYFKMMYNELFPELKQREAVGDFVLPFKSKTFPYCKQVLLTSFQGEKGTTYYAFKDVLCYGPFSFYENPLRRIAMDLTPDNATLITFQNGDINSKPVVYSQQNLLTAGQILSKTLGVKSTDRILVPEYQTSPFGAVLGNFTAFSSGATVVYPSEEWNAIETLRQIGQENCQILFVRAAELEQLVDNKEFAKFKYDSLRTIVVDGSVSAELISKAKGAFKIDNIVKAFGSDEVTGLLTLNEKVAPSTELKITRKQDGKIVHRDTIGDLKVKGPIVAKGWWNEIGVMNPAVDEDGWFSTGKVAKLDTEGRLVIQ